MFIDIARELRAALLLALDGTAWSREALPAQGLHSLHSLTTRRA